MIHLALAVCCSLMFGMIFKYAALQHVDDLALITVNYVVAVAVLLAIHALPTQGLARYHVSPSFVGFGVVAGILFYSSFALFSATTRATGMSLAISVQRVSVVIPFTGSWVIWGETPTLWQFVGIMLALPAFYLVTRVPKTDVVRTGNARIPIAWLLVALFAVGGAADLSLKTYDVVFATTQTRISFMLVFCATAAVAGTASLAVARRPSRPWLRRVVPLGLLLGLVNVGSIEFMLRAVGELPGPLVFPANNVSILVGGAILGMAVWGEKLSRANIFGVALAVLAIFLLSN